MSKTLDEELDKIFVEDYTNGLRIPLDDDAKIAIKRLIVQEKIKEVKYINQFASSKKWIENRIAELEKELEQ